ARPTRIDRLDALLHRELVDGLVVEVLEGGKLRVDRFFFGRGHGSWSRRIVGTPLPSNAVAQEVSYSAKAVANAAHAVLNTILAVFPVQRVETARAEQVCKSTGHYCTAPFISAVA